MMLSRIQTLEFLWKGFQQTGIWLLGSCDGQFSAPSCGDDLGLYFFSTAISSVTGFDFVTSAYLLLNIMKIVFLASCILFLYMTKNWFAKGYILLAIIGFVKYLFYIDDLYLAYITVFSVIPFFLFFKDENRKKILFPLFGFSGFLFGCIDLIRAYSSFPVIIFILILMYGSYETCSKKMKTKLLIFLIGMYAVPWVSLLHVQNERNKFFDKNNIVYKQESMQHVFWHAAYLGFSFLQSNKNIEWSDTCARLAAESDDPKVQYLSHEYNQILKNKVWDIFKKDHYFFFQTLFAKAGVIIWYILWIIFFKSGLYCIVGILCALFYRKSWYIELAFFAAFCVSALPGLLTIPEHLYLLGCHGCVMLYCMYSIVWASQMRSRVFL